MEKLKAEDVLTPEQAQWLLRYGIARRNSAENALTMQTITQVGGLFERGKVENGKPLLNEILALVGIDYEKLRASDVVEKSGIVKTPVATSRGAGIPGMPFDLERDFVTLRLDQVERVAGMSVDEARGDEVKGRNVARTPEPKTTYARDITDRNTGPRSRGE